MLHGSGRSERQAGSGDTLLLSKERPCHISWVEVSSGRPIWVLAEPCALHPSLDALLANSMVPVHDLPLTLSLSLLFLALAPRSAVSCIALSPAVPLDVRREQASAPPNHNEPTVSTPPQGSLGRLRSHFRLRQFIPTRASTVC